MRRQAAVLLIAGALAAPALAHRGHSSLSVVAIDAKGAVTVTHRFAAHDVEPTLVAIAPEAQPSLDDSEGLAALQTYVQRRFVIDGTKLSLKSSEMAGDDLTMTFTGRMAPAKTVTVRAALFGETYSDHSAQVNIRQGGITRTLWFSRGDGAKTARFGK